MQDVRGDRVQRRLSTQCTVPHAYCDPCVLHGMYTSLTLATFSLHLWEVEVI